MGGGVVNGPVLAGETTKEEEVVVAMVEVRGRVQPPNLVLAVATMAVAIVIVEADNRKVVAVVEVIVTGVTTIPTGQEGRQYPKT
mmetsp:Transcript_2112/g.5187  ORF Transcript_2112/g.5187 Transcript_2112/m.5187 type:complete len:85 (+) Transcript_2112:147-401(+)